MYCIDETTENETELFVILHKCMFMYVIFWWLHSVVVCNFRRNSIECKNSMP